jgi:hypothetical protein
MNTSDLIMSSKIQKYAPVAVSSATANFDQQENRQWQSAIWKDIIYILYKRCFLFCDYRSIKVGTFAEVNFDVERSEHSLRSVPLERVIPQLDRASPLP